MDLEEATGAEEAPQGAFGSFLRLLALAGGWVIVGLMVYTVADVILRYIFNRPFSGSIEVTEFAMSAIVFLGIAWCGWLGGHVAVDILERPLENPRLRFVPVILTFISGVLFLAIAWLTVDEALVDRAPGQQHDALAALSVPVHRRAGLGDVRRRAVRAVRADAAQELKRRGGLAECRAVTRSA